MIVRVYSSPATAARAAARIIAEQIEERPAAVLGLPTGHTALGVYDELVRLCQRRACSFRKVRTINLDEFVGLGAGDSGSFYAFMQMHLWSRVGLAPERTHILNGIAPDLARECRRYEHLIGHLGGIDLQLLGLGLNGHLGFNEPARG